MKEIVEKKEVEELLGCEITDEQFEEALKYARHKQEYIYQRERRQVVLQHWYLVKLTEEYVRSLAFSKFTMDLCRTLQDMEKDELDGVEYYKAFLEEKYACNKEKSDDMNMILWNELKKHRGHKVSIVSYGDWDNPADICLECEDCGEVVLDAEIYTLCAREDI